MNDFELPVTRYAQSGDVNIAYQTMGEGPIDLIVVPGIVSHVEFAHEFPGYTNWLRRLAKFARVATADVCGRDVYQATQRSRGRDLACQLDHPSYALDVDLACLVERQLKRDRRRAVDDPIDRAQQQPAPLHR